MFCGIENFTKILLFANYKDNFEVFWFVYRFIHVEQASFDRLRDGDIDVKVKMVYCFVPNCNHSSQSHKCTFFTFPSKKKKTEEYKSA